MIIIAFILKIENKMNFKQIKLFRFFLQFFFGCWENLIGIYLKTSQEKNRVWNKRLPKFNLTMCLLLCILLISISMP